MPGAARDVAGGDQVLAEVVESLRQPQRGAELAGDGQHLLVTRARAATITAVPADPPQHAERRRPSTPGDRAPRAMASAVSPSATARPHSP
jgi:hypothetical protein